MASTAIATHPAIPQQTIAGAKIANTATPSKNAEMIAFNGNLTNQLTHESQHRTRRWSESTDTPSRECCQTGTRSGYSASSSSSSSSSSTPRSMNRKTSNSPAKITEPSNSVTQASVARTLRNHSMPWLLPRYSSPRIAT